jgi:hypothetical protein
MTSHETARRLNASNEDARHDHRLSPRSRSGSLTTSRHHATTRWATSSRSEATRAATGSGLRGKLARPASAAPAASPSRPRPKATDRAGRARRPATTTDSTSASMPASAAIPATPNARAEYRSSGGAVEVALGEIDLRGQEAPRLLDRVVGEILRGVDMLRSRHRDLLPAPPRGSGALRDASFEPARAAPACARSRRTRADRAEAAQISHTFARGRVHLPSSTASRSSTSPLLAPVGGASAARPARANAIGVPRGTARARPAASGRAPCGGGAPP